MTDWETVRAHKLVYLATPYTRYPGELENAFKCAAAVAGEFIKNGVTVYSPITHTHPIADNHPELGHTDPLWYTFNHNIMDVCNALVVVLMESWDQSRGVTYEFGYFVGQKKPIYFYDPKTLSFVSRPSKF